MTLRWSVLMTAVLAVALAAGCVRRGGPAPITYGVQGTAPASAGPAAAASGAPVPDVALEPSVATAAPVASSPAAPGVIEKTPLPWTGTAALAPSAGAIEVTPIPAPVIAGRSSPQTPAPATPAPAIPTLAEKTPAPAAPSPVSIVVVKGDTIYGIARRHGVPVRALIDANGLAAPYTLGIGETLKLPRPGAHSVLRGETVFAIARIYGISVRGLIDANKLAPPYRIAVGQRLALPREKLHTVVKGDTLYSISRRYSVDMRALARANALEAPFGVALGQSLRVPVFGGSLGGRTGTAAGASSGLQTAAMTSGASAAAPRTIPKPPARSKSSFLWPVKGKLISRFGAKQGGLHNDGVNILAPRGSAVKAAENGVVAYVGNELRGYGNLVLVRHAGGWMTAYAHTETILVARGDIVKRGQIIARVGATGSVSKPQMHFELRRGARAIDPIKYLVWS